MSGQIFISYCHSDGDFAEYLALKLEQNGFEIWRDETGLVGGDEWREKIDRSIRDSSALVLVVTPESKDSFYVTYEWIFALGAGLKVVPIKLKEIEPHPRLREIHHHDFTNRMARPWDKLIADLRGICEKEQREKSDSISEDKQACSIEIPVNCPPLIENAIKSLDSVNLDGRREAIKLLFGINQSTSREVLLSALKKHPLNDVRSCIASGLGEDRNRDAIPGLIEALGDTDKSVRKSAAEALGKIGDRDAVPVLMESLRDPDNSVRGYAAEALGKIGGKDTVPKLMEILIDPDNSVKEKAAEALGEIVDKDEVPRLIEALKDTDIYVREVAAWCLGKIGDKAAVAGLMEALRDPDNSVKEKAAEALGEIVDKDEVPRLIEALKDTDIYVREVAAWCLGKIGDKAAVAGLMEALRDPDNSVCGCAAEALGKIGDTDAVPGLKVALKGTDKFVRENAEKALEKLGVMLDVKTQN
jgi:HEAT repeat protein